MGKPAVDRWGNLEFVSEHPVLAEKFDHIKYLTAERAQWLLELYELLTGEQEAKRKNMHKRKMAAARKRRAKNWKEEMAYE